jgi:hypothetical protein
LEELIIRDSSHDEANEIAGDRPINTPQLKNLTPDSTPPIQNFNTPQLNTETPPVNILNTKKNIPKQNNSEEKTATSAAMLLLSKYSFNENKKKEITMKYSVTQIAKVIERIESKG